MGYKGEELERIYYVALLHDCGKIGVPDNILGKPGTDIPLIARIICVADSFDAMNTNRVYRKKLTMDDIIAEIENNKGKQFDPAIADVMLRLLREGKIQ